MHLLVVRVLLLYRNATEITYADAKAAIKSARQETNFVVRFSSLAVSVTSKAKAICEEFCEEVFAGTDYKEYSSEELKCTLNIEHFKGLFERMVQIHYCCTQIQNNREKNKCVAWFEPMSLDQI
mgnify:FL=1